MNDGEKRTVKDWLLLIAALLFVIGMFVLAHLEYLKHGESLNGVY